MGEARDPAEDEFYEAADRLQLEHPLPNGCTASAFTERVEAWLRRIRPNLARPYVGGQAARRVMKMLPVNLRVDARRLEQKFKDEGLWDDETQLPVIIRELRQLLVKLGGLQAHVEKCPKLPLAQRGEKLTHVPVLKPDR